jgi:hypothetical protein
VGGASSRCRAEPGCQRRPWSASCVPGDRKVESRARRLMHFRRRACSLGLAVVACCDAVVVLATGELVARGRA